MSKSQETITNASLIFMESHEDYLARRIQETKDRLLAAQQKVSRIRLELDGLKRQRNAQQMSRRKHITELFLNS